MYGQQQQQQNSLPDYDTEANVAIIIDEAGKLFYKLVKDSINKTLKITNEASDSKSPSFSLLPVKELSDVQKDSIQKLSAACTYRKEEEHTFIQSFPNLSTFEELHL